uniref:Clustered mitochondria protein homolog n=1 Tax=Heterorhabditis bacteriophora TaxID=37862 RepID=A0A1I7XLQ1_HETBA
MVLSAQVTTSGEMDAQVLEVTEKAHVEFQLSDSGHDSVSASPDSDRPSSPDETTESAPTVANVLPQETIYKLTIQSTAGDSFDLQVSSAEMIQELHQVLLERDSTCHRTCFTLQLNGCPLDNFTEIRNIPYLTDGSVLQVVEEAYTVREARIHVRHVRELLRASDNTESAGAVDGSSLSYLSTINLQERKDKDKSFDGHPPEYILPGTKERSLSHLLPPIQKPLQALKNLAISYFNPPPGPRKMKGDVLYIIADTLEKRRLHITCCTKGFFVNSSNDDTFNAHPSNQHKAVYHSLVDLLNAVSPTFKKVYPLVIKKRGDRHVLDRLPTPYPVHFWVAPSAEVSEDAIRAEDSTQPHRVGFEVDAKTIADLNRQLCSMSQLRIKCINRNKNHQNLSSKLRPNILGSILVRILMEKMRRVLAAEVVHSLQKHTFDIRFNPDCFSTSVKHSSNEDIEKQRRLVVEAAEFILSSQLPEFVQSCLDCSITPVDGEGLCELLHSRGINIRYLGEVFKMVVNSQSFIKSLTMCELIARSAKHVLRHYINNLPQDQLAPAISHLLNAIFGTVVQDTQSVYINDKNTKKNNKKLKKASANGEWSAVTAKHIWKAICDEVHSYFGYEVKVGTVADFQLDTARSRTPFIEDDVQNVFPILKHRQPYATDAKKLFIRGQQAMQTGHLRDAYECIAEAVSVNLMTSVYGAMHSELAQAMRMLARLSYILGDPAEALAQQHKATLMSERCNGLDHGYTIIEYINLAHFAFANLFISASLRLLYRARYLLLLAHGEKHPLMAQIDGNIGVILFAVQEFDPALKFLQSAESGSVTNGEPKRLKSALLRHMVARVHSSRGDFRSALAAEKETYAIYNNIFGADHEKTKESSECLKQLTQQAVSFQRKMMDASKSNSIAQLLPIQIQQPSLSSILDVLNILNGIIIISMTPSMVDFGVESNDIGPGTHKSVLTEEALD